ncbi:hypothetical protein BC828DRAFT_383633 [Blastocladiella britannica]|nr:hypothetical protein BC828DRAFT_383633 [Blastocladiella britannica]
MCLTIGCSATAQSLSSSYVPKASSIDFLVAACIICCCCRCFVCCCCCCCRIVSLYCLRCASALARIISALPETPECCCCKVNVRNSSSPIICLSRSLSASAWVGTTRIEAMAAMVARGVKGRMVLGLFSKTRVWGISMNRLGFW